MALAIHQNFKTKKLLKHKQNVKNIYSLNTKK